MNSLLPTGPLLRLQLAADGQWETALHVTGAAVRDADVMHWLATASQDIAVEGFVSIPEGEAFLGMRLAALPRAQQHSLVRGIVQAFAADPGMSAATFVHKVESLTGMPLFRMPPAFLELGKVNAWRSFGSVVFWPAASERMPLDCFRDALAAHPRFLEPSALPYAVEFAFAGELPHWCGLPVSACSGATHSISPVIAEQLLARLRARAAEA